MKPTSFSTNDPFDRLEQLLLRMNIGEELRPDEASRQTGLTEDTCRAVLRGLERAGLMTLGHDDHYVRCKLG
jgi:DNA-binding IclR family transcriptional regulator